MAYSKNRDYTLRAGKEGLISNNRQRMAQRQHSEANSFVKREQAMTASMGLKDSRMENRYYKFDACMVNDGYHAQRLAKDLTVGLDKVAFPVKQKADEE